MRYRFFILSRASSCSTSPEIVFVWILKKYYYIVLVVKNEIRLKLELMHTVKSQKACGEVGIKIYFEARDTRYIRA